MGRLAARLWRGEEGQAITEYALVLVLVSLVAMGSMKILASSVGKAYSGASTKMTGSRPALRVGDGALYSSRHTPRMSQPGWGRHVQIQQETNTHFTTDNTK
jgi:Flp pilus assembly pilin Flp